jgi:hypothetical protein
MDIAGDGSIALLDHVNERVVIYTPVLESSSIIPLPFRLHSQGNLHFDPAGRVAVFDPVGEPIEPSSVNIPHLYLLTSDGQIAAAAPVFARVPAWLTDDLQVVDLSYSKLVAPIDPSGEVNSREIQRQKQPAPLIIKSLPDTVFAARFADVEKSIAFEIRSASPLGAITYFEKVSQGYVVVFEGEHFRVAWFDSSGAVLQDVTLARNDYSEINSLGRIALDPESSLCLLGSVASGIEVRCVTDP